VVVEFELLKHLVIANLAFLEVSYLELLGMVVAFSYLEEAEVHRLVEEEILAYLEVA
jgi:hypothetical protein